MSRAGNLRRAIVAAALGVAFASIVHTPVLLAQEAADRADEWCPAVAKAQYWLAHQGCHITVETLL